MKIYRFRQLSNGTSFCRLKEIIEKEKFWCSSFWELNDPMEGVFSITCWPSDTEESIAKKISEVHGQKGQYKICSFSGEAGFKNLILWGYYADGFKGVAIEIETDNTKVKKVNYCDKPILLNKNNYTDENENIEEVLLNKNSAWRHENEYRFLDRLPTSKNKVGKITAIYFGTPYDNCENSKSIQDRETFKKYETFKKCIIEIAECKDIECFDVSIENGEVKKLDKNLWNQKQ